MKIGIFLATQWPEGAPLGSEIENLCAQVRACPTHAFWTRELARIERELRKTTLAQVGGFARPSGGVRVKPCRARGTHPKPAGPGRGRAKRKARSPGGSVTKTSDSLARRS